MNIMSTWMTLEEFDGADTRREDKGMVSSLSGNSIISIHLDCNSATATM